MQRTTRLKRPQVPEPGALIDFDDIVGRPKYAGEEMTSETDIPSVTAETEARQAADQEIWTEIETIEASSDVVDVVATYAELQQYDTSTLHDKDLIKVLQDETRQNAITYYRYSSSSETFSYVGAEGPYYTASETDTLLAAKQDTIIAGTNVQIAADGKTISATDTTYDDFVGATTLSNGEQGLVPAPLSADADKFLQGDGSWGTPTDTTYTAGANVQISANNEISATDTTYSPFVGASSSVVGAAGLVPQPAIGDQNKYLKGDGTWATVQGGGATVTTFYIGGAPGVFATDTIYKESTLTTVARQGDLLAALESGGVRICQMANGGVRYTYDVISYSIPLGVYTIVHYSLGTTVYAFAFNTATTIEWFTNEMQTKLTAGSNITISSNTISATDTTYSAGTGISIDANNVISATGGGGETVFYAGVDPNTYTPVFTTLYKDSALQTAATAAEVLAAAKDRLVYVAYDIMSSTTQMPFGTAATYCQVESYNELDPSATGSQYSIIVTIYDYATDTASGLSSNPNSTTWVVENVPYQRKLTAGTGITIDANNVISASGAAANNINSTDWNALWQ